MAEAVETMLLGGTAARLARIAFALGTPTGPDPAILLPRRPARHGIPDRIRGLVPAAADRAHIHSRAAIQCHSARLN